MNAPNPFCAVPGGPGGRVESYLAQIRKMGPADIHSVAIGLQAAPTASASATDTYKVPADQDLVVFSLQGYLQFTALATEPTTGILGFLNPDPSERWFMKLQNCNVLLENIDRSQEVFDARSVPMSAISPPVGAPLYYPPDIPYIIPAGHSIRATFALQDTTTAIVGSSTRYGLLLGGALVPIESR